MKLAVMMPQLLAHCLEQLWQMCPEPDAIVVHGTGTTAGDAYERKALPVAPGQQRNNCGANHYRPLPRSQLTGRTGRWLCRQWQRWWKISLGFGGHMAGLALSSKRWSLLASAAQTLLY